MNDLSLLRTFPNEMEARMWESILEKEGIRSMTKPEWGGYGVGGQTPFVPHSVYVLTEDIEIARGIIETSEGGGETGAG